VGTAKRARWQPATEAKGNRSTRSVLSGERRCHGVHLHRRGTAERSDSRSYFGLWPNGGLFLITSIAVQSELQLLLYTSCFPLLAHRSRYLGGTRC